MWVELIFVLSLKKYYKLGVICKYGKCFIFIPKTFLCRYVVAFYGKKMVMSHELKIPKVTKVLIIHKHIF